MHQLTSLLGLIALLVHTGCSTPQTCTSYGGAGSSTDLISEFGASGCQDGHEYDVVCSRPAPAANFSCVCQLDHVPTGRTFERPQPMPSVDPDFHPAAEIANAACGWELRR